MPKRTEHAIYDLKYHLVWVPKYRKSLLVRAIEKRLREIIGEIAMHHGLEIVELELMPNHVHMFVEAPPKRAPGKISGIVQSGVCGSVVSGVSGIAAQALGRSSLGAGYYAGSVGDKVTTEIVRRYIRHQRQLTIKW